MDCFEDPIVGLTWGFRSIFIASIFGLIFMLFAWIVCHMRHSKTGGYTDFEEERDVVGELKQFSMNEYNLEVRRRMHSNSF